MSAEWREVSLDEIAELNGGYAFKSEEYTNEGRFVLRTVNITDDGRISRSGATYVSPESAKKYERFLLKDLDTLFVMVGATLGKTGLVKAFDLPALLNQNMWVVRARNDQVDPLFLHYAFKVFSKPMSSLASGSARGFVKRDDFRQMKIRIPEIRVQREISNLLGAVDDRITLLRETN
ncbi:MAG: restriction endonuclease subunit S, partial [Burkholderiaceae bacterium]|nr:restriction endonuclease subunit S [Burkholderiaceae bacterium]